MWAPLLSNDIYLVPRMLLAKRAPSKDYSTTQETLQNDMVNKTSTSRSFLLSCQRG